MTYIPFIDVDEAEGELKAHYREIAQGVNGRVSPLLKTLSINVDGLGGFHKFYSAITAGNSTLGRRKEEMIATVISALNHCHY